MVQQANNMTIYKVWCEWDMPIIEKDRAYYSTEELADKAISREDWSTVDMTEAEVREGGYVQIIPITVITE